MLPVDSPVTMPSLRGPAGRPRAWSGRLSSAIRAQLPQEIFGGRNSSSRRALPRAGESCVQRRALSVVEIISGLGDGEVQLGSLGQGAWLIDDETTVCDACFDPSHEGHPTP